MKQFYFYESFNCIEDNNDINYFLCSDKYYLYAFDISNISRRKMYEFEERLDLLPSHISQTMMMDIVRDISCFLDFKIRNICFFNEETEIELKRSLQNAIDNNEIQSVYEIVEEIVKNFNTKIKCITFDYLNISFNIYSKGLIEVNSSNCVSIFKEYSFFEKIFNIEEGGNI